MGRLFWHSISLKKKSPIFHHYPTHEVDEPYRWSNSLIVRIPFSELGIVMGWWHTTDRTEEQTLIDAMEGRQMADEEFHSAEKAHLRRLLIRKQYSAEDQVLLVKALDL